MGRGKRHLSVSSGQRLRQGSGLAFARIERSEQPDLMVGPADPTPGMDAADALAMAALVNTTPPELLRERLSGGLIVDLDDTLTVNHCLFLRSRAALVEIFRELDPSGQRDPYEMALFHRDLSNALVPKFGFTPKRWYEGALDSAREIAGRDLTVAERERVLAAAEVGVGIGEFYPGVEATLADLHRAGVPMVLLTKGEQAKQEEKVAGHRLERFFDDIVITDHKDAGLLKEVAARYGLTDPTVIGDSESSDVKPATEADFHAVLVDRGAPKWLVERHDEVLEVPRARSLSEAVVLLAGLESQLAA